MENHYFEVLISNISRADEDLLTERLFEIGASGVSEDLSFYQKEDTYEPITVESEVFAQRVYFESPITLETLQNELKQFKGIELKVEKLPNKDWLEEWKKGFEPFCLVDDIWVVPSWFEEQHQAHRKLFIDPGMAFGTGTHETTQVASELLFELKKQNPSLKALLDVGTGSGILALLSEIIGFDKVEGTEIEPDARRVAKENAIKNRSKNIAILDQQVDDVYELYDVVVANIIDGILVNIQEDLKRACRPGGYLLLTGILSERKSVFLEKFNFQGFEILKWQQKGEWHGLLAQRTEDSI